MAQIAPRDGRVRVDFGHAAAAAALKCGSNSTSPTIGDSHGTFVLADAGDGCGRRGQSAILHLPYAFKIKVAVAVQEGGKNRSGYPLTHIHERSME